MISGGGAAIRPSRCEQIRARGLDYNIRKWGRDDARPIVLLHGTRDCSVTFQFVVDQLRGDWLVVAPDWRGHGLSQRAPQAYWLHEFVADLDAILDGPMFAGQKIPLIGHSLGGNIASVYAGLRPDRLSHLVSLDAAGPMRNQMPVDMHRTLLRLLSQRRPSREHAGYAGIDEVAERLMRANRRLGRDKALFLAEHSTVLAGSIRRWLFDPDYQGSFPTFHSVEEWMQIWARIEVPALWVLSGDPRPHSATAMPEELARRVSAIPRLEKVIVLNTGHNLHHDEPAQIAGIIEDFIEGAPSPA